MRSIKTVLTLSISIFFIFQCATPPRLGLHYKTPMEEGVHVILHPTLNLIRYNDKEKKTTNNTGKAHHFLIEPGKQVVSVQTAYSKKIWAFYSRVHEVAIEGQPGETYLVCSTFVREKGYRSSTGGAVTIETKIDLLKLTEEQKKEIYIDKKVQIDYLRSVCPLMD